MNKTQAMIIAADRSRLHKCWMTVYAEFDGASGSLLRFTPGVIDSREFRDFEAMGCVFVPVAWFYDGFELDSSAAWLGATEAAKADTPVQVQA